MSSPRLNNNRVGTQVTGINLIACEESTRGAQFWANGRHFFEATAEDVQHAANNAEDAMQKLRHTGAAHRARFVRRVSTLLEEHSEELVDEAARETAGSKERLTAELGRTCSAHRLFADALDSGRFCEVVIDTDAFLPTDLRRMNRPLGPVAVFEAGNMPFFLGVAGGDALAAWGAGCPLIVKGHPDHPATSELVAKVVTHACSDLAMPSGFFSFLQGASFNVGRDLVKEPSVRAVTFTGSVQGARALQDATLERPDRIPFYGEMGSANPVFICPDALHVYADQIASSLSSAIQTNRGQVCTKPTVILTPPGKEFDSLTSKLSEALAQDDGGRLMSDNVADLFLQHVQEIADTSDIMVASGNLRPASDGAWQPMLLEATWRSFNSQSRPWQELFGPAACIVRAGWDEMLEAADALPGQLTATVWATDLDVATFRPIVEELSEHVGRLVFNHAPTGVHVAESMHHGGPYPAATHPGFTSVGFASVRRFQRTVTYQNALKSVLPLELLNDNPLHVPRLFDGVYEKGVNDS